MFTKKHAEENKGVYNATKDTVKDMSYDEMWESRHHIRDIICDKFPKVPKKRVFSQVMRVIMRHHPKSGVRP